MVSTASRIALKIAQRQKTTFRLNDLFDFTKRQIEAPLTMGKIVTKKRGGYVEVKCTKHGKTIRIREKKQLLKEDLALCKSCSKERYSRSMIEKMTEFESKMADKYDIKIFAFKKAEGWKNCKITPEMLEAAKEDYFNRDGKITRIGG